MSEDAEDPPTTAVGESRPLSALAEDAPYAETSTAIAISGMHRSGTSLIASAFQLAGLNIGERLLGPGPDNRHGHFEDIDFEQFHERALVRVGKNYLTARPADVREMTPEEIAQAKRIIDQRRERRMWGWKDPRTCLFLDFWDARLTNARYVFVYRHPLDVVLSMFRRRMDYEISAVVTDPLTALECWRVHNQAILDFYRRHRDRCVLGHIRALAGDLAGVVSLCGRRFGLDLVTDGVSGLYHPAELAQHAIRNDVLDEFRELAPMVSALYRQMEVAADLPDPRPIRPARSGADAPSLEELPQPPDARRDCAGQRLGTLGQEIELLLSRVAPGAVLTGRWALDELRCRELHAAAVRQQRLDAQLATVEAQRSALESRAAELGEQIAAMQSELAVAHADSDLAAQFRVSLERIETELAKLRSLEEAARARVVQRETDVKTQAPKWDAFKRAGLRLFGRAD